MMFAGKTTFIFFVFFIFSFLFSTKSNAYKPKSGSVNATFGSYIYRANFNAPAESNNPILAGNALIVNGDVSHSGSLELGMYYGHHLYSRSEDHLLIIEKVKRLHFTMGYKWWLRQPYSVSLTFFSTYSIGDPSLEYSNLGPTDIYFPTTAQKPVEYGFDLALQYDLWEKEKYAVISQIRYAYPITRESNEKSDQYGIVIGLRYQLQGTPVPENERP